MAAKEPLFSHDECRRVLLLDPSTGHSVKGAEAIALSRDAKVLFVAAYDRRTRSADGFPPQGGLYEIDVSELLDQSKVEVRSVSANEQLSGGFRPHGISLIEASQGQDKLAVINRRYFDKRPGRRMFRPAVEIFQKIGGAWRHQITVEDPELCRANDLAFLDGNTLIATIDRSACADFTFSEDVLGFPGGSLVRIDIRDGAIGGRLEKVETAPLDFPNGIVADLDTGLVHVAKTKAASILTFRQEDLRRKAAITPVRKLALRGHPDNISTGSSGGTLVAAVYPDLPAFAAYRFGWFGTAATASIIVSLDETGGYKTLFEDPKGLLFSAASSAVYSGFLIAGSVGDEGLLVCKRRTES